MSQLATELGAKQVRVYLSEGRRLEDGQCLSMLYLSEPAYHPGVWGHIPNWCPSARDESAAAAASTAASGALVPPESDAVALTTEKFTLLGSIVINKVTTTMTELRKTVAAKLVEGGHFPADGDPLRLRLRLKCELLPRMPARVRRLYSAVWWWLRRPQLPSLRPSAVQ